MRIEKMQFFNVAPRDGECRCEARLIGFYNNTKQYPKFHIQLIYEDKVWCDVVLIKKELDELG